MARKIVDNQPYLPWYEATVPAIQFSVKSLISILSECLPKSFVLSVSAPVILPHPLMRIASGKAIFPFINVLWAGVSDEARERISQTISSADLPRVSKISFR